MIHFLPALMRGGGKARPNPSSFAHIRDFGGMERKKLPLAAKFIPS